MLEATHKKDRMVFSILSTLMFVTASSAIYDTPTATAVTATQQAPMITYQMPAPVSLPLLQNFTIVDKFTSKINELEETIEEKDTTLYILKEQNDLALEKQRNIYVSMDQALIDLSSYVGKTPYGFGDSPSRWDCSGLTLWFYKTYRGIEIPHSATAQMREGIIVDAPIPGDIVAFSYGNSSSAFHVGIYVGSGMFIHAKNHSADTVMETVDGFAKNNIKVAYIRY